MTKGGMAEGMGGQDVLHHSALQLNGLAPAQLLDGTSTYLTLLRGGVSNCHSPKGRRHSQIRVHFYSMSAPCSH